jgi:hypothetical protein
MLLRQDMAIGFGRELPHSRLPAAHRIVSVLCGSVFLWSSPAHAADPGVAECLAASSASIKAGDEHRRRAERAELLVCARATCPAAIRQECLRRIDEVNALIPTIVFDVRAAGGRTLSAVKVTMDGEVIAQQLDGGALSVEAGEHTFVFESAGHPPLKVQLAIRESEKARREFVQFGAAPSRPVDSSRVEGVNSSASKPGLVPQQVLAIVAAGVGGIGLGLGTGFGLSAMSKKDHAEELCPEDKCANPEGSEAWTDAGAAGDLSTLFFVVGGVGIAGAVALWFTVPSAESHTQIGLGPRGLQLRGAF